MRSIIYIIQNTTSHGVSSLGLRPNNATFNACERCGHFQTHIKTLNKNREVNRKEGISSCFAIFVGSASVVGFENQQELLPQDSADCVLEIPHSESDRNLGNQGIQNAEKPVVDFAEILHPVDSVPAGSCNTCWEELQTLFESWVHEPTCQNSHSDTTKHKISTSFFNITNQLAHILKLVSICP